MKWVKASEVAEEDNKHKKSTNFRNVHGDQTRSILRYTAESYPRDPVECRKKLSKMFIQFDFFIACERKNFGHERNTKMINRVADSTSLFDGQIPSNRLWRFNNFGE